MSTEKQGNNSNVTIQEPNQEEIKKKLKENIVILFKQITHGCNRKHCYNFFCAKNATSLQSKF